MGTLERKSREKVAIRERILDAAMQLFSEHGIERTTMRSIADTAEYSVGSVYVYFADKDAVLHGLHSRGFGQMMLTMQPLHSIKDPMKRLRKMGKLYLQFALEHPGLYELMFMLRAPITANAGLWREGDATFQLLHSTVQQCIQEGHFQGQKAEALSFLFWGTVHGLASLTVTDRTKNLSKHSEEKVVELAYQSLLKMLDQF